ncbi:MAG TPA: four helix bundle protein [Chitinophagaceae bacterium]
MRSFDFAIRAIKLYRNLKMEFGEHEIAQQIIRSGTSIGAILREAEFAENRKDFVHKLYIGLKKANEINYWLELLYAIEYNSKKMFDPTKKDAGEILKMLVSSVKTIKRSL